MFAFIKGKLDTVKEDAVIIENGDIGYEIFVPGSVISSLPAVGTQVKLYTYTYIREDILALYGFLSGIDLDTFKLLITVNGIGPKAALAILTVLTPENLRFAILSDDARAIAKAPGIGAKTAAKVILELRDKIGQIAVDEIVKTKEADGVQTGNESGNYAMVREDAAQALVSLGYGLTEAHKAVSQVEITEEMTVEDVLKKSLGYLYQS